MYLMKIVRMSVLLACVAFCVVSCRRTVEVGIKVGVGNPAQPLVGGRFDTQCELMFTYPQVVSNTVMHLELHKLMGCSFDEAVERLRRDLSVKPGKEPGDFVICIRGTTAGVGRRIAEDMVHQVFGERLMIGTNVITCSFSPDSTPDSVVPGK